MTDSTSTEIQQQAKKPPFETLTFTMDDLMSGRSLFTIGRDAGGEYNMSVKTDPPADSGLAAADFTRETSLDAARELRNALAHAGVFRWEERYGGEDVLGETEWRLEIVFQADVFTFASSGCGEFPKGFEDMLEAFYAMGLPRPGTKAPRSQAKAPGAPGAAGTGFGGGFPGANPFAPGAASGGANMPFAGDMSQLSQLFGQVDSQSIDEARRALEHMQENPGAYVQLMKEQFRAMPASIQAQMLDMLAASGMYTRDWWENFLRS